MYSSLQECPICYKDNVLYPSDCPGGHMFCLACIKGMCMSTSPTAIKTQVHCPLCRYVIKKSHIKDLCENPDKVKKVDIVTMIDELWNTSKSQKLWIYEGRNNGWWYYDRDVQEALSNLQHTETELEWVICGQRVIIDIYSGTQVNQDNGAIRNIKNINRPDAVKYLLKGIAGMK